MIKLETKRLVLRNWLASDHEDLYAVMKNPSARMGGWEPCENKNVSDCLLDEYIKDKDIFAIELKDSKKVIGRIKIYPDHNRGAYNAKYINYILNDRYCGNGYMTEAVKRIVQYSFEDLKIDLLTAFHYPENIQSKKVLERCGFTYEATIENGCEDYSGVKHDVVCHSIFKDDYFSN